MYSDAFMKCRLSEIPSNNNFTIDIFVKMTKKKKKNVGHENGEKKTLNISYGRSFKFEANMAANSSHERLDSGLLKYSPGGFFRTRRRSRGPRLHAFCRRLVVYYNIHADSCRYTCSYFSFFRFL